MAIEGPLRELGIHDVFQLLDLSRKTGALRVTSALRDNEGTVYFDSGRVVSASIRSNPHPLGALLVRAGKISEGDLERARAEQARRSDGKRLGELLVAAGALTWRELERQVRLQIETVVFELMSWQEGFFSFVEGPVADAPTEAVARISTESLLMEGARRIDEWARIAHRIPHLAVVPLLAPIDEDHPSLLDLLPNEWEMLAMIDGQSDLRGIATRLGRSEFDVAKIAYGLLSTGIIDVRAPERPESAEPLAGDDPGPHLAAARSALRDGRLDEALAAAMAATRAAPTRADAQLLVARAFMRLDRENEALDALRRAAQLEPRNPEVLLALGAAAARNAGMDQAILSWQRYLVEVGDRASVARVREMLDCAVRLRALIKGAEDG
jgi:tetratricopeptide (TPR) repeat protein